MMRIITHTCSECGTIIAGNVLEADRMMRCPGLDCEAIHRFDSLPAENQAYLEANHETLTME